MGTDPAWYQGFKYEIGTKECRATASRSGDLPERAGSRITSSGHPEPRRRVRLSGASGRTAPTGQVAASDPFCRYYVSAEGFSGSVCGDESFAAIRYPVGRSWYTAPPARVLSEHLSRFSLRNDAFQ